MTLRIGYIGLGALGRHLAGSLLAAGFPLTVYDVDASCAVELGQAGATCAGSIAETARASDTIITCLPSPEAVASVVAEEGGVDLGLAWEVIKASSGNSFVHETEGQLILNGSYNINFTMDLARKDLHFAHMMGREFGVPLELASVTEQQFARARAMYGGGAQSPMVVKMLEDAVGTDLRAPGFPDELEPE